MTLENFIYESVSEILNGGYEEVKYRKTQRNL